MTDEVKDYAEAVVVGEAEDIWPQVIEDARGGRLQADLPLQQPARPRPGALRPLAVPRPPLSAARADRDRPRLPLPVRVLRGADVLPAHRPASADRRHRRARSPTLKAEKRLFFFVDDNFAADLAFARELAEALTPLGIRWVTQMSINAAHDEELSRGARGERLRAAC